MDSDLIYAKTASGEEAMVQRALVTQRNLRMILILVDGQSTVADLSLRTGNADLTTEALAELEKGGFIELVVEEDSLWVESKKVEQEIRAAASLNPHPLPPITKEPFSRPRSPASDDRVFVHSTPQGPVTSNFSISQYSAAPIIIGRDGLDDFSREVHSVTPWSTRLSAAVGSMAESVAGAGKGAWRSVADAARTRSLKPIRHSRLAFRSWLFAGFLTVLAIAVMTLLTVFFFPYDHYLPDVETAFGQAIGRPVKVGNMLVSVYPKPVLVLGNVKIGLGRDEIRVSEIRLQPVLTSLITPRKVFHDVVLNGVTLSAESVLGLSGLAASSAKPTASAGIEQVSFEKTDIVFGERVFAGLEGKAELLPNGAFRSLSLSSADRKLALLVTPAADRLSFVVDGVGWQPTKGSPFFFDSLKIQGDVDRKALTIRSMDLRIWEGMVNGIAVFQNDEKPTVSGELLFERINAERLFVTLGMANKITGETAGKISFSTTSESWATILSAINADGEFTMRRGSLRGIDLAEAVRRARKEPVQGGATAFEQLSGKIRLSATRYQLSGLVLSSGLMQSTGKLEVDKDSKVNGKMELKIRGTMNQTSVPISIDGSFQNPVVQAGKN